MGNLANEKEYAHLVEQWHPTKNGDKTPQNTTSGSGIKVWWLCEKGHEWDAAPLTRSRQKQGCPVCSNKRLLSGYNDLATTNPELASEWHPAKNNITPQEVFEASNQKAWWLGSCSHEWESTINSRKQGNTCPYCSNRKVLTGFNDLASKDEFTHIVAEWDYSQNTLKPTEVSPNSNKKVWWVCKENHTWEAIIANRTRTNSGCPLCKKSKPAKSNTLRWVSDIPELMKEWHPDNVLKPNEVREGSSLSVKWVCDKNSSHTWEAKIYNRSNGSQCPICAGVKIVSGENDLASHLSFQPIALEWDIERNTITPSEISAGREEHVFWKCEFGHTWSASPYRRVNYGHSCPTCAGRHNAHLGKQTVADYPALMEQWHSTNTLDPTKVPFRSTKLVTWKCPKNHVWKSAPYKRNLKGTDCPVCAGHKIIVGVNDLTSHANFASIANEWHEDNTFTPQEVTAGSNKSVIWKCSTDSKHIWTAAVYSRVIAGRPRGCPFCASASRASRGEREVAEVLELLGLDVQRNVRGIIPGELDMYIPSLKIAVEFNGLYWHSDAVRPDENYHAKKHQACMDKGIALYNVWEDDWSNRRELVIRFLAQRLKASAALSKVLPDLPGYWSEKIAARHTSARMVPLEDAQKFLDTHHLKGSTAGVYYLGLYDVQERLRAVLVLSKVGLAGGFHLDRYATAGTVYGGLGELLSFAEKSFPVLRLVASADVELHEDALYENNGFMLDKVLDPDYSYFARSERVHKSHYPLSRFKKDEDLLWEDGLGEYEVAKLNGIHRIWDSGKYRYVKDI